MSEETKTICQGSIMSLIQANNHLAIRLHRLLAEEKQNVFFSPLSISNIMAMLLCAAEDQTTSEMRSALGYDQAGIKTQDLASIFEEISVLLKNTESYTLSCANSMLCQKGFDIKEEYKQILSDSFKALLLEVDFQKENEVVDQINEWVKEKTNSMIPHLVKSLDPASVMVLSAVYFKGMWMRRFLKRATFSQPFYNKGGKRNAKAIDMMHMKESFLFYEDKILQALQLPYVGKEIAMLILLPRSEDGLELMEASLSASFVQDLKKKLRKTSVGITLPRFRLEYTKSLVGCFQKLGIARVFIRGAELGVNSDSLDLAVSEILHKAVLEVNEEGSEAAASTVRRHYLSFTFEVDPAFVADHPFAFVIYDTRSDLILFMGRVNEL